MIEMLPLYTIALCSLAIAAGTFVNFVLLMGVRRELSRRKRTRIHFYLNLRHRVRTIENYLIEAGRRRPQISTSAMSATTRRVNTPLGG